MTAPILAVGDLTADIVVELPRLPVAKDTLELGAPIRLEPGGSANFLIAAVRLGARAVALGALGADPWGKQAYAALKRQGVDLSQVVIQGSSTVALVLVDRAGDHAFVGSFGQGEPLSFTRKQRGLVEGAAAVFSSGYSLGEQRMHQLVLAVMEHARQAGVPRFFDPGPAFAGLPLELKERALSLTEVLLLTQEEASSLTASLDLARGIPGILTLGPRLVVLKRGVAGCSLYDPEGTVTTVPGFPVAARDTTAAGECFAAGFIIASLLEWTPEECARLANAAGAAAVQKVGGGGSVPTLAEVRAVLRRFRVELDL